MKTGKEINEINEINEEVNVNKMAEEIAAIAVHEIKNSVQLAMLNVDILTTEIAKDKEHFCDRIMSHLEDVIANVENPFKKVTMLQEDLVRLDLNEVIKKIMYDFEVYPNVTLEFEEKAIINLVGVPTQWESVFTNLFKNSVEALEGAEGTIHITAQGREVRVRDTAGGLKIRPGKYKTTKANGMGLGLEYCKNIARAHGAVLSLENSEDGLIASIIF